MSRELLHIYTDGSCYPNPGPGGWAYYIPEHKIEVFSGELDTTNNRMEMTAVLMAMIYLAEENSKRHAIIYTDSQYVRNGCTKWYRGWVAKNWRKSDGKPVINTDLWKAIIEAQANCSVTVEWVRGHNGTEGNEIADDLAGKGRKMVIDINCSE